MDLLPSSFRRLESLGVFSPGQLLIMFPKQISLFLPYEPESTALELRLVSGPVWEGESGMRKEKAGECFMRFKNPGDRGKGSLLHGY